MKRYIKAEQKYCAHNYAPVPVVITKGKGVWLYDVEGNKYLDMMSGYSAVSHGHAHSQILNALKQQAGKLGVVSRAFYNDNLGEFARALCKFAKMDMMLPMNTGAEAVETAIKAARQWGYLTKGIEHDHAEIIVSKGNFHGRTTTIVGFSSEAEYKKNFGPYAKGFKQIAFGEEKQLEKAITKNTCAFLTEPMQGEGGIILPEKGWLKKVQQICKKNNILLILDEIQTGLGRTGKNFAFEHEITPPDGLIVGKALGGGVYPVSAFLAKREVMELFTPGSHGSTFGGNPIACAVALEALKILKSEGLVKNSARLGKYFVDNLRKIKSDIIKDIRGEGLWIGVEIDSKKAHARDICLRLAKGGLLTKETHDTVIRLAPPLIIKKDEIDFAISVIGSIF